jgi:hypothetical protein
MNFQAEVNILCVRLAVLARCCPHSFTDGNATLIPSTNMLHLCCFTKTSQKEKNVVYVSVRREQQAYLVHLRLS